MTFANLFNFFSELSFNFRNSYQAKVIVWILFIYCLIMAICILKLFLKHPSMLDYTTHGCKKDKRIKKEKEKVAKLPVGTWEKINAKLNSVNPNDWKIAVIEADKTLDEALKTSGIAGGTEGERLKNIVGADVGDNLNNVWDTHRIRNSIVHDSSFELTNDIARKAVRTLENASKAVGR